MTQALRAYFTITHSNVFTADVASKVDDVWCLSRVAVLDGLWFWSASESKAYCTKKTHFHRMLLVFYQLTSIEPMPLLFAYSADLRLAYVLAEMVLLCQQSTLMFILMFDFIDSIDLIPHCNSERIYTDTLFFSTVVKTFWFRWIRQVELRSLYQRFS